jgi:putative ABC transport system ATP-binding protein
VSAQGPHNGRAEPVSGRFFEHARRRKRLSLEEAAEGVGVPVRILEGLEQERADLMPEELYMRGLIRRYTDFLGLDGGDISRRWEPNREEAGRTPSPRIDNKPLMVEARDVNKSYKMEELTVQALKDVSLNIEKGALVAVMGPSGCGKTTLLNVLSGLDEADGGEIFISGEPLHTMNDARRTEHRARQMGFVFQGFNLMPVLSAVENVELPLLVGGAGVKAARTRALEALEQVSLEDRAHHRPNQLSGGQQQRAAIARALAGDPAIVWADEPTGNLDSDTSQEVLDLLLQLNRENGQTFVVVTHEPGVGAQMDCVIQMKDGKIVGQVEDPTEISSGP